MTVENIIVEVKVPACNGSYDFMLPTDLAVCKVVEELTHILQDRFALSFNRETTQLVDMDRRLVLKDGVSLGDQRVQDGTVLILV